MTVVLATKKKKTQCKEWWYTNCWNILFEREYVGCICVRFCMYTAYTDKQPPTRWCVNKEIHLRLSLDIWSYFAVRQPKRFSPPPPQKNEKQSYSKLHNTLQFLPCVSVSLLFYLSHNEEPPDFYSVLTHFKAITVDEELIILLMCMHRTNVRMCKRTLSYESCHVNHCIRNYFE